jgi:hypothetical protein
MIDKFSGELSLAVISASPKEPKEDDPKYSRLFIDAYPLLLVFCAFLFLRLCVVPLFPLSDFFGG